MRRVAERRRGVSGLLTRRPQIDSYCDPAGQELSGINQVDQLRRIVDLYDRGLVSSEELRRQQERTLRIE